MQLKKLPYLLRYIPDQYKTQKINDKVILENLFLTAKKNQQMSNKAVKNYPHALEFVPECYKTHKMCDKAVNTILLQ